MKIGIVADTHNAQQHVQAALARFRQESIDTLLHAGDITNSATLRLFSGFDVWIAKGNMDRDATLSLTARQLFGAGRMAATHTLSIDGVKVALLHGDSWSQLGALIRSDQYAYVIHGHTHAPKDELVGHTRVINPGALGSSHSPTYAILDLETAQLEWVRL